MPACLPATNRPPCRLHARLPSCCQVAYLRSFEHMGRTLMTCVSGCECEEAEVDAHTEHKTSVTVVQDMQVCVWGGGERA